MPVPDRRRPKGGETRKLIGLSLLISGIAALVLSPTPKSGAERPAGPSAVGRVRSSTPPNPAAIASGFETEDARAGAILKIMGIGVAAIGLSIVGLFVFLGILHRQDDRASPLTPQQRAVLVPPGPPLQSHPLEDIAAQRSREFAKLNSYRWLGPDHVKAQIPIERAMVLVVGKPLDPAP